MVSALLKFVPVFVLAGLMISGQDALIAAFLACVCAFIVAGVVAKVKFQDALDSAMKSVSHILVALFILMFAYAMAEAFMSYGVGAAIINIALSLGITAKSVACVGFICCCLLSVATGTSWGTFAACTTVNAEFAKDDTKQIVVMVNGKKRDTFEAAPGTADDVLKETAFARDGVKKFTDGHEVVKVIIVKDKLVNIVVK